MPTPIKDVPGPFESDECEPVITSRTSQILLALFALALLASLSVISPSTPHQSAAEANGGVGAHAEMNLATPSGSQRASGLGDQLYDSLLSGVSDAINEVGARFAALEETSVLSRLKWRAINVMVSGLQGAESAQRSVVSLFE